MKVAITTPAKFPAAWAAARYHQRHGELARIISPVPASRTRRFGVEEHRISSLSPLGAWNYAVQRGGPRMSQPHHQLWFSAVFDETASRMIDGCDVVNPWCSTALRTIRAAHRRGIPAVLEVASAHIVTQTELIKAEIDRYGAGIDRAVISPGVIARTLREYEEADVIVVTSSFVRQTFVERGVPESKIVVIPYGIDPQPAPPSRSTRTGPPRILFVGGCSLRKGIPYLLDAFRRLRTPAELRLVGRENPALFARLGGLPRGVVATGPRTGADLAAEYAAADVFVLPSVEDGYGLVTNEAMNAGLPVVVSDHAGSAEIVREGENGFVVSARDAAVLADRLETLISDAAQRRRMGAAARATAESRTWDTYGRERHELVHRPLLDLPPREEDVRALAA